MNKYLRFTLGIPIFSTGVGIWIADLDVSGWSVLWMIVFSLKLIFIGLWLLDVPTINTTTVNLIVPPTKQK